MKFKFCSDGDCPLWALAALHALAALPAPVFRELVTLQLQQDTPDDEIMEILKDTNLASRSESARACAAVRWAAASACASGVGGAALAKELVVLGLPRAHATALAAATDHVRPMQEHVARQAVTVNKLTNVTSSPGPPGAIDCYKLFLFSESSTGEQKRKELLVDKSQAQILKQEMKRMLQKMEEMEAQQ